MHLKTYFPGGGRAVKTKPHFALCYSFSHETLKRIKSMRTIERSFAALRQSGQFMASAKLAHEERCAKVGDLFCPQTSRLLLHSGAM